MRVERRSRSGVRIVAEWHGGAYVELSFDGLPPSEVLNVWDDDTDKPGIPVTKKALIGCLEEWIREMDSDTSWPKWAEDYVKNARGGAA